MGVYKNKEEEQRVTQSTDILWYAILMWTASLESKDWRKFTVRRRHKIYNVVVEEEFLEIDHVEIKIVT